MNAIHDKKTIRRALTFFFLFLVTTLVTALATPITRAKDYKVEVLVFENLNPSRATESHHYKEPRTMSSKSSTWSLQPSMLLSQSAALSKSPNYDVLHHFSWGQKSLRYAASAAYTIAEPDVRGAIKVYADSLLFVNIDLDYDGYRMNEKRRLKLNQKHFFDHPKFGILLQVSRLEKPIEADPELESSKKETPLKLENSR